MLPDQQHSDDSTETLIRGVKEGNVALVEDGTRGGANLEVLIPSEDGINRTLLGMVAYLGHAHLVAPLVAAGVSLEARGSRQFTPLHHAAREQHTEVMRELIKAGADINAVTSDKEVRNSVLHIPVMWKNFENVDLLLSQKGLHIDIQDGLGYTPLHVASRVNHVPIINRLVNAGANLHLRTIHGWTPLHIASMSGSLDAVKRLVELDLNIFAVDTEGRTPSDLADECGRSDVYWHFIKKAGQTEKSTVTPPQKSARRYDIEDYMLQWAKEGKDRYLPMVRLNQPEPFDGHYQDARGYTTLHYSAEAGNHKFVKVFVEDCLTYAAALTWKHKTPADLARANGHFNIAEYLDNAIAQPKTQREAESLYLQLLETIGRGDHVREASDLLYRGSPIEPTGQHSTHALILAVTTNRRRILTLLIAAGAPITSVSQGYNLLQIAWLSPNISTFIRMIITRVMGFILEDELSRVDTSNEELRDGIASLLESIRSDKPWTARWPDTAPKYLLDFMEQCHCPTGTSSWNNSSAQSPDHLTHLMTQAVQANCGLTTAFLQQAGGIAYAVDAATGESPLTLALKLEHWTIASQLAKGNACLYIPDGRGLLPKDLLPSDHRRVFENEICNRESRKIENEKDKAKDDEVKAELQRIKKLKRRLYKVYIGEKKDDDNLFVEECESLGPKALFLASQLGLSQLVYLLLEIAHLNVNLKLEPLMGSSALHQAAAFGHADLCSLLISKGASVTQTDKFHHTPLHLAAMFGHEAAYKQLSAFSQNQEYCNLTGNTPSSIRSNFCTLLHQYNVLEDFLLHSDNFCECNDPSEAAKQKLKRITLSDLIQKSQTLCVNFNESEPEVVKAVVTKELTRLTEAVALLNPVYKGELVLLGSAGDNTRLHAPDEFDFNLCVHTVQDLHVEVIQLNKKEACLNDHPKNLEVTSNNPQIKNILEGSNWKNNFYTAVVQCLEDHSFSDKRLSLVPPGVTRTQVGVELSLAWQGQKYPLLLIGVDLVPVLQAPWPVNVDRPYLTPEGISQIYFSSIGEGMWRLSFANLEAAVLQSLQPEERQVYLTCKTLLSCMKAEPWMPKAVKNKFTWWNSRRWKIPIPSGFALKNCFLRRLEEKRKNHIIWNDDNLACSMLHIFKLMAEKESHKKTGKAILVSKKIYPYFGGEFEKAKLGEGSLEILKFLESYC